VAGPVSLRMQGRHQAILASTKRVVSVVCHELLELKCLNWPSIVLEMELWLASLNHFPSRPLTWTLASHAACI